MYWSEHAKQLMIAWHHATVCHDAVKAAQPLMLWPAQSLQVLSWHLVMQDAKHTWEAGYKASPAAT